MSISDSTGASILDVIMDVVPVAIVAAPPVLAALSPPTIPMFPPQGAVQPGAIAQGGGELPVNAVLVRNRK